MTTLKEYYQAKRDAVAAFRQQVQSVANDIAEFNPDLDFGDVETAVYQHFYGDAMPYGVPKSIWADAAYEALQVAA